jgi:hypothetical protein
LNLVGCDVDEPPLDAQGWTPAQAQVAREWLAKSPTDPPLTPNPAPVDCAVISSA